MLTARRLWPRTIRWRLTALLATVMGVLLALLIGVQYVLLRDFLYVRTEALARDEARLVAQRHPPPPPGRPAEGQPEDALARLAPAILRDLETTGLAGQVLAPSGALVAQTTGAGGGTPSSMPPPAPSRDLAALTGSGGVAYRANDGRAGFAVFVLPLISAGDRGGAALGLLRVAAPLAAANSTLQRLLIVDLGGLAAGIVLVLLAAPWLAGLSLRPLRRILRAADAIGSGEWQRRADLPCGADEVGQLGDALRRMVAKLEELFVAQQRFVADASHELRTPLTSFRSTLEVLLLQMERTPQERMRMLGALRRETLRMSHLVDDMLALTSSESRRPRPSQPLRLAGTAHEALEEVGDLLAHVQVSLRLDSNVTVEGDPDALRRVVRNLLENAAAFTDPGGSVGVSVEAEGTDAVLRVRDTGRGIPAEHLPHIFDRLYRVDPSRTRARGGSGLGLAIARSIVVAHGGTLSVESRVGEGSTFSITLPALQTVASQPVAPETGG